MSKASAKSSLVTLGGCSIGVLIGEYSDETSGLVILDLDLKIWLEVEVMKCLGTTRLGP